MARQRKTKTERLMNVIEKRKELEKLEEQLKVEAKLELADLILNFWDHENNQIKDEGRSKIANQIQILKKLIQLTAVPDFFTSKNGRF